MEIYEREAILTFADSEHIDNRCALGLNLEVIWTGDFRSAAFLFCNYMDAMPLRVSPLRHNEALMLSRLLPSSS